MKWYEQKYVNHRDWILDNYENLNLSHSETIIVLLIDFLNQNNISITGDILSNKAKITKDELDKILGSLCARKYLDIIPVGKEVSFSLNGLFETDIARDIRIAETPLFDTFETEFARPLTSKEMQQVTEWNRMYDRQLILYALRNASAYQKLSMAYINKILVSWQEKGVTAEMIENGKYAG